jgi:VPDSG-CTERM motif
MRITLSPITKLALLCTALAGALLTFSNSAQAFSIRDADASLGHSERSTYVNHLTDLTGPAVRSDGRSNGQYFGPGNSTRQALSTDRINDRNTASPGRIITIPNPGGVPGGGTGVPDGGTTVMLLGAALGALGVARRYLRS